jgi:H/ACA ribonucleoprotein complex subunit 3
MGNLKKCETCNRYTLQDQCPECGEPARDPAPPKFSFPDKYGEYRRQTKRETREPEQD